MTIEEYKAEIKAASTKQELDAIRFKACKEDTSGLLDFTPTFKMKPKTLYERVSRLVRKREYELGLIDASAYVETDDNGNYINKGQLKELEQELYTSLKKIFA